MKKLYPLLFLLLGISILSCKPDEGDPVPPLTSCTLSSKKYMYPDKTFNESKYIYSSTGQLQKTEEYNTAGNLQSYQEYAFSNGRPTKLTTASSAGKTSETMLTYDNNQLKKLEYLEKKADQSFGKLYDKTFEYSGDKISRVNYTLYNGGSSFYALYEYTGENITTVKAYENSSGQLLEEDYYQYDDKVNPFYHTHPFKTDHVQESSKNNIVHLKIISHRHIPELPEVFYSYEYNSNGKPTKKIINAPGWGAIAEEIYLYTCK